MRLDPADTAPQSTGAVPAAATAFVEMFDDPWE
jgi:hypothetical protein